MILEDTTGATFGAPIDLDITPGQLVNGQNTLEVRVKNFGVKDSNVQSNPAGILYGLHVTYNTICDQVPPSTPPTPSTPPGGGSGNQQRPQRAGPARNAKRGCARNDPHRGGIGADPPQQPAR